MNTLINVTLAQVKQAVKLALNLNQGYKMVFEVLSIANSDVKTNSVEGDSIKSVYDSMILVKMINDGTEIVLDKTSFNDGNNIYDVFYTYTFKNDKVSITETNTSYGTKDLIKDDKDYLEALSALISATRIEDSDLRGSIALSKYL